MTGRFKKIPNWFLIVCSILIGLLLAEAIIRIFSLDWRYIKKIVYIQDVDVKAHQTDPNPKLFFRLKPGSYDFGHYKTSINSLGVRGPERSISKPNGVFRIICVGGSNVYGAMLNDDQTWPAQLEAKLNSISPGRFEVWNLGVSGYVGSQMAIVAQEAVDRYDPDLVILALSNRGVPAFLSRAPIEPYFKKDASTWRLIFPKDYLDYIPLIPYRAKIWLIQNIRLFRFSLLGVAAITGQELTRSQSIYEECENQNALSVHRFLEKNSGRVRICIFICPTLSKKERYVEYFKGLNVPVFLLFANNLPKEYENMHPPAYVMTWYADRLSDWLIKNNLLQERRSFTVP